MAKKSGSEGQFNPIGHPGRATRAAATLSRKHVLQRGRGGQVVRINRRSACQARDAKCVPSSLSVPHEMAVIGLRGRSLLILPAPTAPAARAARTLRPIGPQCSRNPGRPGVLLVADSLGGAAFNHQHGNQREASVEAVILIGLQAAGKSSFYKERFFATHVRINLDMLRTRNREWHLFHACLETRQPFVIDNTNPTADDRARYIEAAKDAGFTVVGYYFESNIEDCLARNDLRARPVPHAGLLATARKLTMPTREEGFDALHHVRLIDGGFEVTAWPDSGDASPWEDGDCPGSANLRC